MNASFAIVAQPNLREQVAGRVREAIVTGHFPPGHRLIERELCELMGVSRTSVREALRELETEGLVTTLPNRGPIVSLMDSHTAEQVFQVRVVLEGLVARLFARNASEAQLQALERAVEAMDRVYLDPDVRPYLSIWNEFYRVFLDGAGNDFAAGQLRNIHARVAQVRAASLANRDRAKASYEGLKRLMAALRARDEAASWEACTTHVEGAAAYALGVLRAKERQTPQ